MRFAWAGCLSSNQAPCPPDSYPAEISSKSAWQSEERRQCAGKAPGFETGSIVPRAGLVINKRLICPFFPRKPLRPSVVILCNMVGSIHGLIGTTGAIRRKMADGQKNPQSYCLSAIRVLGFKN